jgi:hypothetical protein
MDYGDITIQDQADVLPNAIRILTSKNLADSSTTQAVTGVGFKPSAVVAMGNKTGTAVMCWGDVGGDGNGYVFFADSAGTGLYQTTNPEFLYVEDGSATATQAGTLQSFDTDGFTISWVKGAGSPTGTLLLRFLAFK